MFTNNMILSLTFIEDGTTTPGDVAIATPPQLTKGTDHYFIYLN